MKHDTFHSLDNHQKLIVKMNLTIFCSLAADNFYALLFLLPILFHKQGNWWESSGAPFFCASRSLKFKSCMGSLSQVSPRTTINTTCQSSVPAVSNQFWTSLVWLSWFLHNVYVSNKNFTPSSCICASLSSHWKPNFDWIYITPLWGDHKTQGIQRFTKNQLGKDKPKS